MLIFHLGPWTWSWFIWCLCSCPVPRLSWFQFYFVLDFREEEARMEELAVMGGFADTKFLSRTLSSQIHRLRSRCEIYWNSICILLTLALEFVFSVQQAWDALSTRTFWDQHIHVFLLCLLTINLSVWIVRSCQEAFAMPVKEISPNLQACCMLLLSPLPSSIPSLTTIPLSLTYFKVPSPDPFFASS